MFSNYSSIRHFDPNQTARVTRRILHRAQCHPNILPSHAIESPMNGMRGASSTFRKLPVRRTPSTPRELHYDLLRDSKTDVPLLPMSLPKSVHPLPSSIRLIESLRLPVHSTLQSCFTLRFVSPSPSKFCQGPSGTSRKPHPAHPPFAFFFDAAAVAIIGS